MDVKTLGSIFCFSHIIPASVYDAIDPTIDAIKTLTTEMTSSLKRGMKDVEGVMSISSQVYGMVGISYVPSLERGGIIQEEGLYYLHPHEIVIPPNAGIGPTIYMTNYITIQPREVSPRMSDLEKRELANEISRYIEQKLRWRLS